MVAMYSEMVEGGTLPVTLGGSGSGSGIWPVETATVHAASWFGSRGRLPLPMVIASPSCHTWDAKATPCGNRNWPTTWVVGCFEMGSDFKTAHYRVLPCLNLAVVRLRHPSLACRQPRPVSEAARCREFPPHIPVRCPEACLCR